MRSPLFALLVFVAFPMLGSAATSSAAPVPSPSPSIPLDVPRFEMYGAHGTNVEVRYELGPSAYHGEVDPGPHVARGVVAIVSGPNRTDSLFTFAQLGMLPPKQAQIIPSDVHDACGASGPIDIAPLPGYVAPAAVVVSVAIGKGCEPIVHTFVPTSTASRTYAFLPTYDLPGIGAPQHARASTALPTFRVISVRTFALTQSPAGSQMRGARIAIAAGTNGTGKRSAIAFDLRSHAIPKIGSTYVLDAFPNGLEGVATPVVGR